MWLKQPTGFALDTYELDTVLGTPELIQSLSEYAYTRQLDPSDEGEPQVYDSSSSTSKEREASLLLLHIRAAADYFTHDAALMKDPPPVLVDLILDPYTFNLVPRSLLPTIGYIVLVSVVTWFVASFATTKLHSIVNNSKSQTKKNI